MKILCDFDGVLTDLTHEAERVREIFVRDMAQLTGIGPADSAGWVASAETALDREPHCHGWRWGAKITAFGNEDGFIRVNGVASCLDDWAVRGEAGLPMVAEKLRIAGHANFKDLAQSAYMKMVAETASGVRNPLDVPSVPVLSGLIAKGVEVVIVSNSGTDRIVQLLKSGGLSPVSHASGISGPLRVRGDAKKFCLGLAPRTFQVGDYVVDTDRPHYESIILEEKPDAVIGDVFSLDLALPNYLAGVVPALREITVILRKRDYTPSWSLDYIQKGTGRDNSVVLDELDQLLELA